MKRLICACLVSFLFSCVSGAQGVPGAEKPLFDTAADGKAAIESGLIRAKEGKRLLLIEFGADWCPDCMALVRMSEEGELRNYLEAGFVIVRVDVGRFDKNVELAASYGVPIKKGIPAVSIVDPDGMGFHATAHGELANARRMDWKSVLEVLKKVLDE